VLKAVKYSFRRFNHDHISRIKLDGLADLLQLRNWNRLLACTAAKQKRSLHRSKRSCRLPAKHLIAGAPAITEIGGLRSGISAVRAGY